MNIIRVYCYSFHSYEKGATLSVDCELDDTIEFIINKIKLAYNDTCKNDIQLINVNVNDVEKFDINNLFWSKEATLQQYADHYKQTNKDFINVVYVL